jgi:hypothetical protein
MTEAAVAATPTSAPVSETPAPQSAEPADPKSSMETDPAQEVKETKPAEDEYLSDEDWAKFSKKKRKLKIGDEDAEMTLEEIARNTALNKVLTGRGQEAAAHRKEAQETQAKLNQFFEKAQKDPTLFWQLMEKLGHDPRELAILKAKEAYEWDQKSEVEKRAIIAERERDRLKAEREAELAAKDAEENDKKLMAVETEIQTDITDTIKELGITPDAVTVERIAQAITFLYNRDDKKPTTKDVAQFVLQNLEQDVSRYVKKLSPEKARELFGKEFIDQFQASLIKQAEKNLPGSPSKRTSADDSDRPRTSKKEIGIDDWFNSL